MACLLRWMLITVLLLRVAAGGAWAMPMAPHSPGHTIAKETSALPPCHALASDATAATTSTPDTHAPTGTHASGAHCALCFPATVSAFRLPLATIAHSMPSAPRALAFRWQRTPELRPPI